MPSKELLESWNRTIGYLLDARSHLSETAEGICANEIHQFREFLDHNELELALDELQAAFDKSGGESLRVLELLALAAASMGLLERVARYDASLSNTRGVPYTTTLP
jgi:hypothetical protein